DVDDRRAEMIGIGNVADVRVRASDRDLAAAGKIEMAEAADVAGEHGGRLPDRVHIVVHSGDAFGLRRLIMSPAGLTRGSIFFVKNSMLFREKMDCRVKPGNDDPGDLGDGSLQLRPRGLDDGGPLGNLRLDVSG